MNQLADLAGEKWGSRRGRTTFIKEGNPQAKQGKNHALTVSAIHLGECGLSVGTAQENDALIRALLGVNHTHNITFETMPLCKFALGSALSQSLDGCRGSAV